MNVLSKLGNIINHNDFLTYLLAITVSTILVGYATSSIFLAIFSIFVLRYNIQNPTRVVLNLGLILSIAFYFFCALTYFWSVDKGYTNRGLGRLSVFFIVFPSSLALYSVVNSGISLLQQRYLYSKHGRGG